VRNNQQVPTPALEKACTIKDGWVSDKVIEEAEEEAEATGELDDAGDEEECDSMDGDTQEGLA